MSKDLAQVIFRGRRFNVSRGNLAKNMQESKLIAEFLKVKPGQKMDVVDSPHNLSPDHAAVSKTIVEELTGEKYRI